MKQIPLSRLAKEFNLSASYFSVMKKVQPDKFKYIFGLDSNRIKAYRIYLDQHSHTRERLIDAYYILLDKREFQKFCRFANEGLHYTSGAMLAHTLVKALFNTRETFYEHKTLLTFMLVLKKYEEYKKLEKAS